MATAAPGALPELASVPWRRRADPASIRREGWLWTLCTAALVIPFVGVGIGLALVKPFLAPITVIAFVHAWAIPELYAARGANVVKPRRRRGEAGPEHVAVGLLGDLVGHEVRELHARTGLVLERGRLGVWLLGEAGALLVRAGGRRVHCYCVGVREADPGPAGPGGGGGLPSGDRKAHLLLALREDESGLATVANLAFSGAPWRVARRLRPDARGALRAAVTAARD